MEVVQERRKMSPERTSSKVCVKPRMNIRPTFKKVQIVYYLSRNGHLEHPHYMEVTHLAHQQLRLKDVMDRLTLLRGKGMPSLYSWSCKRSYKNGYVWNDLAENDVIYPSEGAEYVLKGSELIEGCTEKLHQLQVGNVQDSKFQPKRKSLASKRHTQPEEMANNHHHYDHRLQNADEEDDEVEEYEEKTSNTRSTTPHSRCSRGVSTDDIGPESKRTDKNKCNNNEGNNELSPNNYINNSFSFSSPPSAASSTPSDKANNNDSCKISEDGDPLMSRNSMLLSLIACGGSASFRKAAPPPPSPARKSGGDLRRGVVCKAAAAGPEDDEMRMMIGCMSENPRFGNKVAEEKEYFSGSIVEAIVNERVEVGSALKKSSSHNEERSNIAGLGEEAEDEVEREKGLKGKCIPRKKSSSSKNSKK